MANHKTNSDAFYNFIREDKSIYPKSSDSGYIDPDNDFLIGDSGGFLMNYNFKAVNTDSFREVAKFYEEHGTYTKHAKGTLQYKKFYNREEQRRLYGLTLKCKLLHKDEAAYNVSDPKDRHKYLKPLRITGDMYNFLNYTEIQRVEVDTIKRGIGSTATKSKGFPRFFMSQYWLSKSINFCINNGFNLVIAKSRRAGFSYFQSSRAANRVNLIPKTNWVLSAYDKKYLIREGGLSTMVKSNLDFYEFNTPFNRNAIGEGLVKKDLEELKVGFKDAKKNIKGYRGTVFSVSFGPSNPDAAIGKDAVEIDIEELTNAPNLNEFINVTNPTTKAGSMKTGILMGWGTTGSREGSWQKFRDWFFHPGMFDGMPFENVWDTGARHTTCGFFKPYWESLEGYDSDGINAMDEDGNSNYRVAIKLSDAEREEAKKEKSETDFIVYCGQYANTPAEAFFTSTVSMFSSQSLIEHAQRVVSDPELLFHIDGMPTIENQVVKFRSNAWLEANGIKTNPFIPTWYRRSNDNVKGCVRQWYPPFRDASGNIPDNLYYVTYDTFGKDKISKNINRDDSLACIQVYQRASRFHPIKCDRLVASYTGRPDTMEDADRICLHLCQLYGASNEMLLPEVNRGEIIKNFKTWKMLHLVSRSPLYAWDTKFKEEDSSSYGIVMTEQVKNKGLQYLKQELYEIVGRDKNNNPIYFFQYIYDIPYLEELLKYNFEGNFDRVSTGIVQAYFRNSDILKDKEVEETKQKDNSNSIHNRQWYG